MAAAAAMQSPANGAASASSSSNGSADFRRANPEDDYELMQRVGSGTYGEVYKARDIRTGKLAAVKAIKLEAGDNFAVIQQEIIVLRGCRHPNIIAYFGSYLRRDRLFICMDYCGGGSLQDIYHMTGPLTELQIAFVVRETLKGLAYLHSLHKVHRDVKGANILLTLQGDVKLADFGVAAQITATLGKRRSFIGTPYWMAPEVACVERVGAGYGVVCDVWAVGITAIELAECQPPLFELQPMQVLYLMTKSNYKPPVLRDRHKWSPLFHDFVRQCLTKSPKRRPTPDQLLKSHEFVQGALSSRMTRDLLDKVNNGVLGRSSTSGLLPSKMSLDDGDESSDSYEDDSSDYDDYSPDSGEAGGKGHRRRRRQHSLPHASFLHSIDGGSHGEGTIYESNAVGALTASGYYGGRTLPAQHHEPLPDLVQGQALLADRDGLAGVPLRETTFTDAASVPRPPPRPSRRPLSTSALSNKHDLNNGQASSDLDETLRAGSSSSSALQFMDDYRGDKWQRRKHFAAFPSSSKVPLGACWTHVAHDCRLHINASASWEPSDERRVLLLAADEGIFALDLLATHDGHLRRLHDRRCTWLHVHRDVLMARQGGKTPYLFRYDLPQLTANGGTGTLSTGSSFPSASKFNTKESSVSTSSTAVMSRLVAKGGAVVKERLNPKKLLQLGGGSRLSETKYVAQCVVDRLSQHHNGLYMAVAVPGRVLLYQWYEPLQRFLRLRDVALPAGVRFPLRPFQLVRAGRETTPRLCIGIRVPPQPPVNGDESDAVVASPSTATIERYEFEWLKFDGTSDSNPSSPTALEGLSADENGDDRAVEDANTLVSPTSAAALRDERRLDVCSMRQLDANTIMFAYRNRIVLTDLSGTLCESPAVFQFSFRIDSAVPLGDAVLAFHGRGVEGRAFASNMVTQHLYDPTRSYRLLTALDRLLVVRSERTATPGAGGAAAAAADYGLARRSGTGRSTSSAGALHGSGGGAGAGYSSVDVCLLTGHDDDAPVAPLLGMG